MQSTTWPAMLEVNRCHGQLPQLADTCGGDRRYLFVGCITVAACSARRHSRTRDGIPNPKSDPKGPHHIDYLGSRLRQGDLRVHVCDKGEVQVIGSVLNMKTVRIPSHSPANGDAQRLFDGSENNVRSSVGFDSAIECELTIHTLNSSRSWSSNSCFSLGTRPRSV